jgi:tRNA A37 threonylcarbamoyladenosine dehydratase
MRERIAHINPACDVRCVEEFVVADNWPGIAAFDLNAQESVSIIDACDQVRAKTAMAAWALQHNAEYKNPEEINFISVGAAGGKRHAHKVEIDDLAVTTHDPLLAQLRYRLRKEHGAARQGKIGVNCVFSRESVMQPGVAIAEDNAAATDGMTSGIVGDQSDGSLNCHGYGSVVSVTSTFGICAAGWVLFKIAG